MNKHTSSELKSSRRDTITIYEAKNPLVSIVVPVYNVERFLDETVISVQAQTFSDWELILVDDCSTDGSLKIAKKHAAKDPRIILLRNKQNSGAALSRNAGIDAAKGSYLAFLDADDLWAPTKLEKQLTFMVDKDCAFSFTGYEFADATGKPNGKKVYAPASLNYRQALKNTTISTITVVIDLKQLSKNKIHMPNIHCEDTATWWYLLRKQISCAYGLPEILSYYRRSENTLSSNKLIAIKRTWHLYRDAEALSFHSALYYFGWYLINAVRRRI